MLSLNTLPENAGTLRATEPKGRARAADDRPQAADFQSYLATALQQQGRAEPPQGRPEKTGAADAVASGTPAPRAEAAIADQSSLPAQKAGHDLPNESDRLANKTERPQAVPKDAGRSNITVTRTDRELLETLGLIHRSTSGPEKKPATGTQHAAFAAHTAGQPARGAGHTALKGNLVSHTLTLLESTPDLVLMSSDGLKKLGEKLGLSLLGKVHEKLGEKNRSGSTPHLAPRDEMRSEPGLVARQMRNPKAGSGDAESYGEAQQARNGRQGVLKSVSRETTAPASPALVRETAPEQTAISLTANHDNPVFRPLQPTVPSAEIRLSEAGAWARATDSMRAAVETPLLRPDLVRQFQEILSRAQVLVTDTQNAQFSVKLFPREIGRMEIDLKLIDGEIRGKIVVENEEVKSEMENFLQDHNSGDSPDQRGLNQIDIEVRNGNENARNPQRSSGAEALLQNLVTRSASAAYSAVETAAGQGGALYA